MEALLELERVQRVLSLMSSRGLCDRGSSGGGAAADRFLAHADALAEAFGCDKGLCAVEAVQPSDSLTMEMKFQLVSELLGKATPDTLDEVQHATRLEDSRTLSSAADQVISSGALLQPNKNFKMQAEKSTIQAAPMVGFDAMMRAKSTLEDFLDASNEDSLGLTPDNSSSSKVRLGHLELERKKEALDEKSLSQMIEPLDSLLQSQGLMTDRLDWNYAMYFWLCKIFPDTSSSSLTLFSPVSRLRTELKSGIQYWSLERKLCQALIRNEKISIDDVMKAIHLKSFDYRVLNLLMYQLTGQQVNELHMDFLSISEFLVEISDDLYDYEAKCIGEAEEQYESLSKKLDPSLSGSYWRRCEEATKEGGKLSGHAYGTWNIPPVICDEESFRRERLS
nr:unnamed protein product [Digitaria exilis]